MINIQHKVKIAGNVKQGGLRINGALRSRSFKVNGSVVCNAVNPVFDYYDGPYEVTPTQSTQTLSTQEKILLENVIVNPIPNNYGLITWNGNTIKVS